MCDTDDAKVVSLLDRIEEKRKQKALDEGKIIGPALCLHCKHEFEFEQEWPAQDMECPECGLDKAVPKALYGRDPESLVPVCEHCGCDYTQLSIYDNKMYLICILCGAEFDDSIFTDFGIGISET